MMPLWLKRDYRAISYALASCVVGVLYMRIAVYFTDFPQTYAGSIASDAFFALPTQLLFFLLIPFAIYTVYGKRTVKQTLSFSSCGKFKPYYLFAVPIGIAVYAVTIGVSSAWMGFLRFTGYVSTSFTPDKPAEFSAGLFVAEILLTALLPAVCEEFAMRGGVLSTVKHSLGTVGCIVFCGIAFGLFHQNVRQVFYTSLFGAFAAYITLNTKSLYPAMIMHFTNNFCSILFDYAYDYNWSVNYFGLINSLPTYAVLFIYVVALTGCFALTSLMLYLNDRRAVNEKRASGALSGSAYGRADKKYAPEFRDVAGITVVGFVAALTTLFTYIWGFYY